MPRPDSWPVRIETVASDWGCAARWLKSLARQNKCGRKAGKSLILFEADYDALIRHLPIPGAAETSDHNATRNPPRTRSPTRAKTEALIEEMRQAAAPPRRPAPEKRKPGRVVTFPRSEPTLSQKNPKTS